jgi:DNA-binding NarL/FixJ family response regulator
MIDTNLSTMILKTNKSALDTGTDSSDRSRHECRQQGKALHELHEELEIRVRERLIELVNANEALQVEIAKLKQVEQLGRRQTQVLCRTLNALTAEPDLDKFLEQVLIAITEHLAVSSCVVWLYDPETESRFLHLICSQGQILTGAQVLGHPNALKPHAIRQHLVWLTEFQASHPVIMDDIGNYSYLESEQHEYLMTLGVKGILEVPLILDKEVIGYLAAYNTERERFTTAEIELAHALTHHVTLAIQLTRLAEKAKQEAQQSAVVEERNRIAQELHNSLRHLQEVLTPNNAYPFDDAKDVAKANHSEARGYLLQDTPTEVPAGVIRSIHQGYTQFEPGIQEKMIAKILATEPNKLEKLPPGLLKLTAREREILRMIATGANNREIALALYLTEGTVRNYISQILSRLNVRDRTQAALVANTFLSWLENSEPHNRK